MLTKLKPTIALIDSGIGGISVLRSLINRYGNGNYVFYADNLNMPYGNKSKEFVKFRVQEIIEYLNKNFLPDIIIVACNTASTCIDKNEYSNVYTIEVRGDTPTLATPLTKQNVQSCDIIEDKTLAQMVERHILNLSKIKSIAKQHVKRLALSKYKTLVLGCTHYELVSTYFKEFCPETEIINNSQQLIQTLNFKPDNTQTNVIFLQSKKDDEFNKKMWQILKS